MRTTTIDRPKIASKTRPFGEGILPKPSLSPISPLDAEAIPADVVAIRIVHGADHGEYKPVDGPQGREWSRLDDSYGRIGETAATRAYKGGRLAILSTLPVVPTKALPPVWTSEDLRAAAEPVDHRAESVAWKLGFDLARDGEIPALPKDCPKRVRAAFANGLEAGEFARASDLDLSSGRSPLLERPRLLSEGYHEMGMQAPLEG
jgi:hypothetical protein